jgi:hypothetical protein
MENNFDLSHQVARLGTECKSEPAPKPAPDIRIEMPDQKGAFGMTFRRLRRALFFSLFGEAA